MRLTLPAAFLLAAVGLVGCSTDRISYSPAAVEANSPRAEAVAPLDAYPVAEAFVMSHQGTCFMVGSGDSMMPLYKDRSVLIVRPDPMGTLRPGMTVVFLGECGVRVAHVLVKPERGGWITMGIGNASLDSVRLTEANYAGVVVKAYEPMGNPMLALIEEHQLDRIKAADQLALDR